MRHDDGLEPAAFVDFVPLDEEEENVLVGLRRVSVGGWVGVGVVGFVVEVRVGVGLGLG